MIFTDDELAAEEWRNVAGYEGRYEISSLGRLRSWCRPGRSKGRRDEPFVLEGYPGPYGHISIVLRDAAGKPHSKPFHRMVLESFVGPCPDGMVARHFPDRTPSNNRLTNLQWSTQAANMLDKRLHGTQRHGTSVNTAILNDGAVMLMRWLKIEHAAQNTKLADWFGVHTRSVEAALRGWTWRHVKYGLPAE